VLQTERVSIAAVDGLLVSDRPSLTQQIGRYVQYSASKIDDVELKIERLRTLDIFALRDRWKQLYGHAAPHYMRHEFLLRAVAYQIQVEMFGGLSAQTKRRLRQIADELRKGKESDLFTSPKIKPGTKLIRSWKDETHIVTALEIGFEWKRKRFNSLSEIARKITGTRWNGLLFFGVKRRPSGNKNALKRTEAANA